jgi:hypothetical protein
MIAFTGQDAVDRIADEALTEEWNEGTNGETKGG